MVPDWNTVFGEIAILILSSSRMATILIPNFSGYPVDRLFWKSSFPELPLQNCMCLIHLNIIAYVIGGIPYSSPLCNLFFRINNFVCTVSQKKFFLYIPFCTRYNRFCTEFFEQGSSFKGNSGNFHLSLPYTHQNYQCQGILRNRHWYCHRSEHW